MAILCIETATPTCSVALGKSGKLLAFKDSNEKLNSHSEDLTPYIQEVLNESKITVADLEAVAVSKGPGSFTGLRIGVSAAKGLCYSLGIPLISIDTLKAMTSGMISSYSDKTETLFCPALDARRDEIYCAVYDQLLNVVKPTSAEIVTNDFFRELRNSGALVFFGNGADKCERILSHPKDLCHSDFKTSARYMLALAEKEFKKKNFEDLAYFEPYYLKDFISGDKVKRT